MEFVKLFQEIIFLTLPHTYMELGVKKGHTFNKIAPLVKRAIAVDITECGASPRDNVEIYKMSTDEFVKIWKDPIDFLFIDADHRKAQVIKDFDNFSSFVKEGTGIIALHDTHPKDETMLRDSRCSNAYEAAWEFRTNSKYRDFEVFTLPGGHAGLTLIRKSKKQLSWK